MSRPIKVRRRKATEAPSPTVWEASHILTNTLSIHATNAVIARLLKLGFEPEMPMDDSLPL